MGVFRQRRLLDFLLKDFCRQRPVSSIQDVLRIGIYQVLFLQRVPDYAAVNEMVDLAKRRASQSQGRFVNAVLRRIVGKRCELKAAIERLKRERPAIGYSCPGWLYRRWRARFKEGELRSLLEWQSLKPEIFVRVNRLQLTGSELLQWGFEEGLTFEPVVLPWKSGATVFRLPSGAGMASSALFRRGGFYVQDPSTLKSVELLDPQQGNRVLDLCAAPGGKTAYMAERMNNTGEIVACDIVPNRLQLVEENCRRLGVENTTFELRDGTEPNLGSLGLFDRVLVDVPCSNTGVLRRRCDLRWRLSAKELSRLTDLQGRLLRQAAQVLGPGGRLVYSTCSIEPEENQDLIDAFVKETPGFVCVESGALMPHRDGVDGAFFAKLIRA